MIALAVIFPEIKPTHGVVLLKTQAIIHLVVLSLCFVITAACRTFAQRFRTTQPSEEMDSIPHETIISHPQVLGRSKLNLPVTMKYQDEEEEDDKIMINGEEKYSESVEAEECDLWKHKVLLLLLSISMFTGISLCIWTLVTDELSGIYLELVFLYGFLNQGQAILTFGLFGVDLQEVVLKVKELRRTILYRKDKMHFPEWQDLKEETKLMSSAFKKYHEEDCKKEVLCDIIQYPKSCSKFSFTIYFCFRS